MSETVRGDVAKIAPNHPLHGWEPPHALLGAIIRQPAPAANGLAKRQSGD